MSESEQIWEYAKHIESMRISTLDKYFRDLDEPSKKELNRLYISLLHLKGRVTQAAEDIDLLQQNLRMT